MLRGLLLRLRHDPLAALESAALQGRLPGHHVAGWVLGPRRAVRSWHLDLRSRSNGCLSFQAVSVYMPAWRVTMSLASTFRTPPIPGISPGPCGPVAPYCDRAGSNVPTRSGCQILTATSGNEPDMILFHHIRVAM